MRSDTSPAIFRKTKSSVVLNEEVYLPHVLNVLNSEVYKPVSVSLPSLSYTLATLQVEMRIYCPYVQLWTAAGPKSSPVLLMQFFGGGEKKNPKIQ
jgi:hypothetical protein